jgi:DNA-binding LytR/AlgR family response regulator
MIRRKRVPCPGGLEVKVKRIRTIIIEDSEIDMEHLRILLEDFAEVELVGTADTIASGMALAESLRPELILADVQLGADVSLDHLGKLAYEPMVICTTLYDDHALQAFDVGATDYLLKPVTSEALTRALGRLSARISSDPLPPRSVLLRSGNKAQVTPLDQILLIEADCEHSTVMDSDGNSWLCSRRMPEWRDQLPADQFVVLDRSTIVNLKQISTFTQLDENSRSTITFLNGQTHLIGSTALIGLQTQ